MSSPSFLLRSFVVVSCAAVLASGLPVCDKDLRAKFHNDFVLCRARSRVKLSDGKVTACQFLSESVGVCGKLLEQCRRGGKGRLRKVKRNSLRVSVRALAIDTGFSAADAAECDVLQEYGVSFDEAQNGSGSVEGKCDGGEFKKAYQSFVDCKSASEETLKSNLASLGPKRDQKKADGFVCTHFEHTLHHCFSSLKKCSTSAANWLETRKAFVLSIDKTNREQKLGFNLARCDLEVAQEAKSQTIEVSPGGGSEVGDAEADKELLEEMADMWEAEKEAQEEEEEEESFEE